MSEFLAVLFGLTLAIMAAIIAIVAIHILIKRIKESLR